MAIDDQIKDEKRQYNINREALKILPFSLGKLEKYEYLTGEELRPSNQKQIIEQAKLEKQTKTIEDQGKNKLILQIL